MSGSRYAVDIDPAEKNTSHALMLDLVGGDKRVLDVGCAEGDLARAMIRRGCTVTGVEYDAVAAEKARPDLHAVIVADLSKVDLQDAFADQRFDVVVLGDVLEHLTDPLTTLRQVRRLLTSGGYLVISLPNVAHASVRLALLNGEFRYRDVGLLDATHLRFFTRESLQQLLADAGLAAVDIRRTTAGPFDTEIKVDPSTVPQEVLDLVLADPDATTYQFVLTAAPDDADAAISRLREDHDRLTEALRAERDGREAAERALSAKEQALSDAEQALTEARRSHEKQQAALASENEHRSEIVRRVQANLVDTRRQFQRQLTAVTEQAAAAAAERAGAQQAVRAMELSTSWRLSAPIRILGPLRNAVQGPVQTRRSLRSAASVKAVLRRLRQGDMRATTASVRRTLAAPAEQAGYLAWIKRHDTLDDNDREAIERHIQSLEQPPVISVVMPVYRSDPAALLAAVDSVRAQLYPHWELCIADDASGDAALSQRLDDLAALDPRIKVLHRPRNGGIAAATNSALDLANGEFVALLDHDDLIAEHALYLVAVEAARHPGVALIYSDEDKLDREGRRTEPYFKPDFNLDLLLSQNCISHLGVYRSSLIRQVGGLSAGVEGSQDHDLALRVVLASGPDAVRHIPFVLYHWRQFSGSGTFSATQLDKAAYSSRHAVQEALDAAGVKALVEPSPDVPSWNRIRWTVPTPVPAVTVIIPTRDRVGLLRDCLDGVLQRTEYEPLRVLIVDNESTDAETLNYLDLMAQDDRVDVLRVPGPFNYAQLNNRAVDQVQDPLVLLLNNDIVVRHKEWLWEMVAQVSRAGVGAVGAKLLYADERVQHAGVLLGIGGVANHAHLGLRHDDPGYFGRAVLAQDVSAVTAACLLTPTVTYRTLGGFDEVNLAVAFNDVDYCLRVGEGGQRVVWTPFAELYHLESVSRGKDVSPEQSARFHREIAYMHQRWGSVLRNDPAYNPNLSDVFPDFSLSETPRVVRPWAGYLS